MDQQHYEYQIEQIPMEQQQYRASIEQQQHLHLMPEAMRNHQQLTHDNQIQLAVNCNTQLIVQTEKKPRKRRGPKKKNKESELIVPSLPDQIHLIEQPSVCRGHNHYIPTEQQQHDCQNELIPMKQQQQLYLMPEPMQYQKPNSQLIHANQIPMLVNCNQTEKKPRKRRGPNKKNKKSELIVPSLPDQIHLIDQRDHSQNYYIHTEQQQYDCQNEQIPMGQQQQPYLIPEAMQNQLQQLHSQLIHANSIPLSVNFNAESIVPSNKPRKRRGPNKKNNEADPNKVKKRKYTRRSVQIPQMAGASGSSDAAFRDQLPNMANDVQDGKSLYQLLDDLVVDVNDILPSDNTDDDWNFIEDQYLTPLDSFETVDIPKNIENFQPISIKIEPSDVPNFNIPGCSGTASSQPKLLNGAGNVASNMSTMLDGRGTTNFSGGSISRMKISPNLNELSQLPISSNSLQEEPVSKFSLLMDAFIRQETNRPILEGVALNLPSNSCAMNQHQSSETSVPISTSANSEGINQRSVKESSGRRNPMPDFSRPNPFGFKAKATYKISYLRDSQVTSEIKLSDTQMEEVFRSQPAIDPEEEEQPSVTEMIIYHHYQKRLRVQQQLAQQRAMLISSQQMMQRPKTPFLPKLLQRPINPQHQQRQQLPQPMIPCQQAAIPQQQTLRPPYQQVALSHQRFLLSQQQQQQIIQRPQQQPHPIMHEQSMRPQQPISTLTQLSPQQQLLLSQQQKQQIMQANQQSTQQRPILPPFHEIVKSQKGRKSQQQQIMQQSSQESMESQQEPITTSPPQQSPQQEIVEPQILNTKLNMQMINSNQNPGDMQNFAEINNNAISNDT